MRASTVCCVALALCFAADAAIGATAIVIDPAEVYANPKQIVETLPRGAKVATGSVSGEWVNITYQKPGEETARSGWVMRALLEEIPQGFDTQASEHCILHAQEPNPLDRFDLAVIEELCAGIARSLVNGEGEPPFNPKVKLRIYLLNGAAFAEQAKRYRNASDSTGFSPKLGQLYLDFGLQSTSPQMKGLAVHELSLLVLGAYSRQPQNRRGAGAPLPVWLVEAFATYHEYRAGFRTQNLVYVSDKPKLGGLTGKKSVPKRNEDRREYLATAGTLGHMLCTYGTREQFSLLVRRVQSSPNQSDADNIMLELYGLSRSKFQSTWARYVAELKKRYNIEQIREDIEEEEDDKERKTDPGDFSSTGTGAQERLARLVPKDLTPRTCDDVASWLKNLIVGLPPTIRIIR